MMFEKLTDEERAEWAAFVNQPYSPEAAFDLPADGYWLATRITQAALYDEFDFLVDIVAQNAVDIARHRKNKFFDERLRRAYEYGVANEHAGCCCNLANYYHDTTGKGAPEDYDEAIRLYEMGADFGDAQARVNLGYIYYYGRGVEVDYAKAYERFAGAALTCDHPEGYYKLGDLYAGGRGVRQSDWIAWQMYERALSFGAGMTFECRAAHHVADFLMKGIEGKVMKDPERALELYVKAELGYYHAIDEGLTYYTKCLEQAIESQREARAAIVQEHMRRRAGESAE